MPLKTQAAKHAKRLQQEHLLKYWEELSEKEQIGLAKQIAAIDPESFLKQQTLLRSSHPTSSTIEAYDKHSQSGDPKNKALGKKILSQSPAACIIVAGGQGSRLGFDGPKGMFPVSIKHKKTLYQIFAERTLAASKHYKQKHRLAIMTSKATHEKTENYFKVNHFFGLDQEQIQIFCQRSEVLLDDDGQLFLDSPSSIAAGPNGNGDSLKLLYEKGIWEAWHENQIAHVNFIQVDNPLADPFDPELIGFHYNTQADITIKCIERIDPSEKVGVIVQNNGRAQIIEYTELSDHEQNARQHDGRLKHLCANISLFCFKMDFVKKLATDPSLSCPFHLAHKAVNTLSKDGKIQAPTEPNAWKFERFIFDVLPFAQSVRALIYPRNECFSPLKNKYPPHDINDVQKALESRDRAIYEQKYAKKTEINEPFELSSNDYYF